MYGLYFGRFGKIAARTGVFAPEFQDNIYVLCWAFVGLMLGLLGRVGPVLGQAYERPMLCSCWACIALMVRHVGPMLGPC